MGSDGDWQGDYFARPGLGSRRYGDFQRLTVARDDDLPRAIIIGHLDGPAGRLAGLKTDPLNLGHVQSQNCSHGARLALPGSLHQLATLPDQSQSISKGQAPSHNQRREFAQAMSGHVIWPWPIASFHRIPGGDAGRQQCRLLIDRLSQAIFRAIEAQLRQPKPQELISLIKNST